MPDLFNPAAVEAFHHRGWDYDAATGVVRLRYSLDDRPFEEQFTFPNADRIVTGVAFERALTLLHLCAGTSYYKMAAPAIVTGVVEWAAPFVRDLYLHGLAEYAMANGLDPVRPEMETVTDGDVIVSPSASASPAPSGSGLALLAVGGGKDSIVAIESARRSGHPAVLASVGTHRAIEETVGVSGLEHLVVRRSLDSAMVLLNENGARNGHVPVTAINSCALAALAAGLGFDAVVMSNESSASVAITSHRGVAVNHQWSKSLDCERALAALLPVPYFSLLRTLHEVEICRRFARLEPYFGVVTSCNQAYTAKGRAAGVRWCGACPKCRFVFLAMAAFLDPATVLGIFDGNDLLADPGAVEPYRAVLGLGGEPPMECVGTTRESRWALARLAERPAWRHCAVVRVLVPLVDLVPGWDPRRERSPHQIPDTWQGAADALA